MTPLDPIISAKIDALDLTLAKQRLMDAQLGEGWSAAHTEIVERKFKNFLKLISTGIKCVPTKHTDIFWHTCILDTRNYRKMCKNIFGRYIDHDPYMQASALDDAWHTTCQAYQQMFGEPYTTRKVINAQI
jgi:hypothetical protein